MTFMTKKRDLLKCKKVNLANLEKSKKYLESIGMNTDQIEVLIGLAREDLRRARGLI